MDENAYRVSDPDSVGFEELPFALVSNLIRGIRSKRKSAAF